MNDTEITDFLFRIFVAVAMGVGVYVVGGLMISGVLAIWESIAQ